MENDLSKKSLINALLEGDILITDYHQYDNPNITLTNEQLALYQKSLGMNSSEFNVWINAKSTEKPVVLRDICHCRTYNVNFAEYMQQKSKPSQAIQAGNTNIRKNFYDLDEIKAIKIEDVCQLYSIEVKSKYGNLWCAVRDEKTPSVKIYTTTNTFYDYGGGDSRGGNVINFVAYAEDISNAQAIVKLAVQFHIQPINNYDFTYDYELTDAQYNKIGIYGDLVTKNFNFDFSKYTPEKNAEFAHKYSISVNELKKQYPHVYANMLRNKAFPFVYDKRNEYYLDIYNSHKLCKECGATEIPKETLAVLIKECEDVKDVEKVLGKAIEKVDGLNYSFSTYDVPKDLQGILNGTISFEVGNQSYAQLKQAENKTGNKLCYQKISTKNYHNIYDNLQNVEHSAFIKADTVNISYSPQNAEVMKGIFNLCKSINNQSISR